MKKKKYKFTKKHRENLSIAHKNQHSSPETEFKSGAKHPDYIDGRTLKKYYFIDDYITIDYRWWTGTSLSMRRWESGNCFKTKRKAEKALIKTKELLTNL